MVWTIKVTTEKKFEVCWTFFTSPEFIFGCVARHCGSTDQVKIVFKRPISLIQAFKSIQKIQSPVFWIHEQNLAPFHS